MTRNGANRGDTALPIRERSTSYVILKGLEMETPRRPR